MGQIITWGSDRDEDEFGGREVAAAGRKKENAEAGTMRRRWRVKFVAVFTCQDQELSQRSQRAEHAGNPKYMRQNRRAVGPRTSAVSAPRRSLRELLILASG